MTKKQFIAGAVCPRCAEMDKIVMYRQEAKLIRECVRCGFSEEMPAEQDLEEIATRVNQPRAGEKPLPHEDEIQVVTLIDPLQDGRHRRDH